MKVGGRDLARLTGLESSLPLFGSTFARAIICLHLDFQQDVCPGSSFSTSTMELNSMTFQTLLLSI